MIFTLFFRLSRHRPKRRKYSRVTINNFRIISKTLNVKKSMKLGKITQNSKQRPSACLCLAARSPQSFCTLYKMASITLDRSIDADQIEQKLLKISIRMTLCWFWSEIGPEDNGLWGAFPKPTQGGMGTLRITKIHCGMRTVMRPIHNLLLCRTAGTLSHDDEN